MEFQDDHTSLHAAHIVRPETRMKAGEPVAPACIRTGDLKRTDSDIIESALLLLAVYVAGQMVATPAKALLEDVLVGRILGRPTANLLREKTTWTRFLFPGF
jgi:hypothetical protein